MSTKIAPNQPCSYLTASPPALHPGSGWFAHDPDYFAAQMDVLEIPCGDPVSRYIRNWLRRNCRDRVTTWCAIGRLGRSG
jgi:hypothetical protein